MGLLRAWLGFYRRPPGEHGKLHLGRSDPDELSVQDLCISTHWEPIEPTPGTRHGVNLRNFEAELLASVRVRRFDGADTWEFLD